MYLNHKKTTKRQCAAGTIVVYGRSQGFENTRFCQTTTVHQKLCLFVCLFPLSYAYYILVHYNFQWVCLINLA